MQQMCTKRLIFDISTLLDRYIVNNHVDDTALEFLSFLRADADCCNKNNLRGHFTVSAWIMSNDHSKVLLIHHLKLQSWFQIGGHIELKDESVISAIYREIYEEVGIPRDDITLEKQYHIAIHGISSKYELNHKHYDFIFVFTLKQRFVNLTMERNECDGTKWVDIDSIKNFTTDKTILKLANKYL